jgi:hypothetical protein
MVNKDMRRHWTSSNDVQNAIKIPMSDCHTLDRLGVGENSSPKV